MREQNLLGFCPEVRGYFLRHINRYRGCREISHLALTSLRARFFLLGLILSLSVFYVLAPVYAQTVSVSNLQYSSTSILGKQITVSFTVNYGGASVGDILLVSVWDIQTNSYAPGSTVSSNPSSCPQATGTYSWAATCDYFISDLQGSETVSFALAINSVGTYQFLAYGFLADSTGTKMIASTPLEHAASNPTLFSISVIDKFTLTVDVPDKVSVTLDGAQEDSGYISLQLYPGSHTISVPDMVQIDSTSRLKFSGWLDGSKQTTRTFSLEYDTNFGATYVTQYLVNATADSTLQSGWYDQGTVLQFTVDNTPLVNKYRLLVGGFDGWYNGGQLIAKSPSASLTIDGPVNLSDRWNYLPYLPPVLIVAVVGVILFFARRGSIPTPRLPELKMLRRKRLRKRTRRSRPKVETLTTEPVNQVRPIAEVKQAEPSKPAKAIMYCNQCGAVISRDSKFCKECGAKLQQA